MNSDKPGHLRIVSTLFSVWLLGVTAAVILAYLQSLKCSDCKPCSLETHGCRPQQQTNSSTDELLNNLMKYLKEHLDDGSDVRVRRALAPASSTTLLFRLLDSLIQDSLHNVCRSSDKVCLPGPEGEKGEQGQPGWPGYKGEKGSPGVPGGQGKAGKIGPRGVQGVKGIKGEMGEGGKKGDTGIKGERGFKGDNGIAGEKGSIGEKGDMGSTGFKGEKGVKGTRGLHGLKGNVGSHGVKGQKGEKGVQFQLPSSLLPRQCSNHGVLNETWRKVSLAHNGHNCDRYGRGKFTPGWKRFSESIGGRMPESCPDSPYRCGANRPGWLNGTHPTVVGQRTSMKVCFYYRSNCCHWQVNVQVTNCGLYYVYNLPNSPTCSSTYCGSA